MRGYTKDKSSGVSAPGTFAGLKDKIPYLKDLGINAVELMPIFEFDEMESARVVDGVQLYNYWGYNTVSFLHRIPAMPSMRSTTTRETS